MAEECTFGPARGGGAPLGGVVHASDTLAYNNVLMNQTPGAARAVFAPKAQGLRRLGEQTFLFPVRTSVLFSSVTATVGSAGQVDTPSHHVIGFWSREILTPSPHVIGSAGQVDTPSPHVIGSWSR